MVSQEEAILEDSELYQALKHLLVKFDNKADKFKREEDKE